MESYIIHIYRRDGADPDSAAGLIEGSTMDKPAAFSDLVEVLDILRARKPGGLATEERSSQGKRRRGRVSRVKGTPKPGK